MNKVREEPKARKVESTGGGGRLTQMLDYDFSLNNTSLRKLVVFLVYLCMWAGIYIANYHYGEKTVRNIEDLRRTRKDLKADYYTLDAELSNRSVASQVAIKVLPMGLKPLRVPPKRLKITKPIPHPHVK